MRAFAVAVACAWSAHGAEKPFGENWLDEPGFEKVQDKDFGESIRALPGGYTASSGTKVEWVNDAHSGRYALALTPAKDQEWFRFPIIVPGGKLRTFAFHFWAKTEFDVGTGDAASFYLHMSTPGFVGTGKGFPRTRFRYLSEWTHVGGTITTDENTLGWFRFILYTTRPGLRALLDDVFFAEVTGMPEERVKEVLGDSTLTPRMVLEPPKGEPVQLVKGNKLANASFELPANCGWAEFGGGKLRDTSLVTDDAAHGKACVRIQRLWYQRVALRPFVPHTFSAHFKPAGRKTVRVELLNAYSEGYRTDAAQILHTFELRDGWDRYAFAFTPPPNPAATAYALRLTGEALMDAAQLEEGALSDFKPSREVEYGLSTASPFNLFLADEEPFVDLAAFNGSASARTEEVDLVLQDYRGRDVWSQRLSLQVPPADTVHRAVQLPANVRGALRAQVRPPGSPSEASGTVQQPPVLAEQIVSLIPPPRNRELTPESIFGALVKFNDGNLAVAQRLGIKWSRDHWSCCWYRVEPEPGKWTFDEADAAIDRALRYGVSVFGVLHGTPKWASIDGSQEYASVPKDWSQWERYVEQVVGHFKGRVKVWEVWNEPQSAELYYELCRHSYAPAKRANPDCLVIGCSSTLYSTTFLKEFAERGGLKHLDEVSSHLYHYSPNLGELFARYSDLLGGKPVWNTEGGGWGGSTFYSSRLDHKPDRPGVQQVGRYYTTVAATPKARMHCYYWQVWPADYTPAFEYSWTFFEYDSSVKPEGVAYAVTAHELEGAKFAATLSGDNLRVHLFQRDKGALVALWWEGEGELRLALPAIPAAVRRRDIMGNDTVLQPGQPLQLTIDKDVQFLQMPLPTQQVRDLFSQAKPDKATSIEPELVLTHGPWQVKALEGGDTFRLGYHGGDPKGVLPVIERDEVLRLGIIPTEHPQVRLEETDQTKRLVIVNENQNARLTRTVALFPDRAEIELDFRSAQAAGQQGQFALHLSPVLRATTQREGAYLLHLPTGERLSMTVAAVETQGVESNGEWQLVQLGEGEPAVVRVTCRSYGRGAQWHWRIIIALVTLAPAQ